MSIKAITNYKGSHCEVCGGACDQHPYLCEMHRPLKEERISHKFAPGILILGNWKPILMEEVELVTHRHERQTAEIYMTGTMLRERRLYRKKKQPIYDRLFRQATFKVLDSTPGSTEKTIVMADLVLRVNSYEYSFSRARHRYNIQLGITQWYLSER